MVGFDQPTTRQERREWWRRQLSRQQAEKISVTEFCRQLGIHFTTYYYWKKRIHEVSANGAVKTTAKRSSVPVGTAASFIPVSLVDRHAGTHLEIELANACVVRLDGAVDSSLLQAAIAAAGEVDRFGRGAG